MTAAPGEARPTAAWLRMLDQVEETLGRSLACAEAPAASPPPDGEGAAAAALRRLDEGFGHIETRLGDARRQADEADAELAAAADAVRGWLDSLKATQQRLTEWAASAA